MNLKALLIVIAVLAVASAAVFFSQRSGSSARAATADERVGQPVLPTTIAENAARVTLANNGQSVELARNDDGSWTVVQYHQLPADFAKLARLVRDLSTTDVERFVTANAERIARLDFGETRITLADAAGTSLWSLASGRTPESAG